MSRPPGLILFDRDGTLNRLVFSDRYGIWDTPPTAEQFQLLPGAIYAVRRVQDAGWKAAIISNQPGIGKNKYTREDFEGVDRKLTEWLAAEGLSLDARYFCFHHPEAANEDYRAVCECRKPLPGLILQAARDAGVRVGECVMIGDTQRDIEAGKAAGCRTVLVRTGPAGELARIRASGIEPDLVASDVGAAVDLILGEPEWDAKSSLTPRASMISAAGTPTASSTA